MSCATNLTAESRHADYKLSITFPPLYNFSGANIKMQVRNAPNEPGAALIEVTLVPSFYGSVFTFVGNRIDLLIKKEDLDALPDGPSDTEPYIGVYDIIITSSDGVASFLFGGEFIVYEGVTR